MGHRNDNSLILEVKTRNSIVSVIESYITLKKAGKNYVGLCPFHDDNHPSMRVNDEKGLFHCFACGQGGDTITFYMKYNNLSFNDALKELAAKAGIKYELDKTSILKGKNKSNLQAFYRINHLVERFYIKYLHETKEGEKAITYLKERGLDDETINIFKIGYAPDKWECLVGVLNRKNVPLKLAEKIGLIIKKNNSEGYYDRFRGRVLFPIYDLNNNIAGFGGRTMIGDNAKYLNSPESDIYSKSNILYGLNCTRSYIREASTAILVEGYMDLLTLYSHGIRNVIATLGTSITKSHSGILKRIADKIILAFDGDTAGTKASYRAMDILHSDGLVPYVIKMPSGQDPSLYIYENGKDKFEELVDKAVPIMELYFDDLMIQFHSNKRSRSNVINDLTDRLNFMSDKIDMSYYIKRTSELLGIREESIYGRLKGGNTEALKYGKNALAKSYKYMFPKVLIKFPELKKEINEDTLDLIADESVKKILNILLTYEGDITYIMNYFDDTSLKSILTEIFFSSDDIEDLNVGIRIFNDCFKRIRLKGIKNELSRIKYNLSKTSVDSNHEKLMEKYRDLVKKEKDLNSQIHEI